MVKVAINGFGRIGRVALRVTLTKYSDKVKIAAINTSGSMDIGGWAHLFEYDSVYGKADCKVQSAKSKADDKDEIGKLILDGQEIPVLAQREPAKIPWKKYQVETVIESTGIFRDRKSASAHLVSGAKKVLISAPAKGVDTYIIGVNDSEYRGGLVVSNASCTTNCVAPVAFLMMEAFGVQKAMMSTIHAYTADQELVDGSHPDLRRARSAAINIVPTTTGAAIATAEVLPGLKGIFDGRAFRVPVACGSVTDFCFVTTRRTSVEEVNRIFEKAAKGNMKGIVEVTDRSLVSTDIIGSSASAIVDLSLTQVIDGDLVKLVAWYDNEWGYCCRLVEMVAMMGSS